MKTLGTVSVCGLLLFVGIVALPGDVHAQTYYQNQYQSYPNVSSAYPSYGTPSYASYSSSLGSYGNECVVLASNLSYGARGSEVSRLQQFLVNQGYPGGGSWMVTGYFGDATLQAVRYFQQMAGIPVTGYLDAATRTAIQSRTCSGYGNAYSYGYSSSAYPYNSYSTQNYSYPTYSYPTYPSYPYSSSYPYSGYAQLYDDPEIEDVSGPRTLDVGELGEWEVEVDAPRGSYITASVDWDDDSYGYGNYGYDSNAQQNFYVPDNRTLIFTYVYREEGRYEIRFRVRGSEKSDTETITVRVEGDSDDRLRISDLDPDSGEVGDTITIEGSGFTSTNDVHFGFGGERDVDSRDDGTEIRFEIPEWISQCDIIQHQYGYYCGAPQRVVPGVYPIYITNNKGTSNTLYFEVED